MSSSSDSNQGSSTSQVKTPPDESPPVEIGHCGHSHHGRKMLDVTLPISGEKLFRLVFDPSAKFFKTFIASRGCTDINMGAWFVNDDGLSCKEATWINKCNSPIGIQKTNINQKQVVLKCNNEGSCAVAVNVVNTGVPLVDYFYVQLHYCIKDNTKQGTEESQFTLFAEIKFRKEFKDVMDILKRFIVHNTYMLLEDFYVNMTDALLCEIDKKGVAQILEEEEEITEEVTVQA